MNKSTRRNDEGVLLTLEQTASLLNLGISTVQLHAKQCGALLKIGRSVRIDREKLMAYLRTFEA